MTKLLQPCLTGSPPPDARANFEAARAIYADFFGGEVPAEFGEFLFWPWELELLRLEYRGDLETEAAFRSWRRLMRTTQMLTACAARLGIEVNQKGRAAAHVERLSV